MDKSLNRFVVSKDLADSEIIVKRSIEKKERYGSHYRPGGGYKYGHYEEQINRTTVYVSEATGKILGTKERKTLLSIIRGSKARKVPYPIVLAAVNITHMPTEKRRPLITAFKEAMP